MSVLDGQGGRELLAGVGAAGQGDRLDAGGPGHLAAEVVVALDDRSPSPCRPPGVEPDAEDVLLGEPEGGEVDPLELVQQRVAKSAPSITSSKTM
jgi:hypothetical protein